MQAFVALAGPMLSVLCINAAHAAMPPAEHQSLSVPLGSGVAVQVELVLPTNRVPRALVIVVPGSGGLSDPFSETEMKQSDYDAEHRGGLTAALVEAGFAAAYYSQRGYAPLRDCIRGADFNARAASFAARCVDGRIRAQVSLSTITDDTAKVFSALRQFPRIGGLDQIALAYSEGMHHVSSLVAQGAIVPIGIVGVGGPHISLADTWAYQIRHDFYFNLADKAARRCPATQMTASEILTCAGVIATPTLLAGMNEAIAGNFPLRIQIETRRLLFGQLLQNEVAGAKRLSQLAPSATMVGAFGGVPLAVAYNAAYAAQAYGAHTASLDWLASFPGKAIYLFGARDHLVPLPAPGPCRPGRPAKSGQGSCEFRIISDLAHGLEDETGMPSAHSLDRLVQALNEVDKP